MKKVLDVLDPRKARDSSLTSATANKLVISQTSDTFEVTQLSQAIKAAGVAAAKSKAPVSVVFPPQVVTVKSTLNLATNVHLIGQTVGDEAEDSSFAKLVFESGASLVCKGENKISNLVLSSSKKTKPGSAIVTVVKEASLEVLECVLETPKDAVNDVLGLNVMGKVNIKGCLLTNWRLEINKDANSVIEETQLVNTFPHNLSEKRKGKNGASCAVSLFSAKGLSNVMKKVEITDYDCGVLAELQGTTLEITESVVNCVRTGLNATDAVLNVKKTKIHASNGVAVVTAGQEGAINCDACEISGCEVGYVGLDESNGTFNSSSISNFSKCGINIRKGAKVKFIESAVTATKEEAANNPNANGIQVESRADFQCVKSRIVGLSGLGVICQDPMTTMGLNELEMDNNLKGGIVVVDGANVSGKDLRLTDNGNSSIDVRGTESLFEIDTLKISGGTLGVHISSRAYGIIKKMKCFNLKDRAVHINDASAEISDVQINNKNTRKAGISVKFEEQFHEHVMLKDCKLQNCSEGIRIDQAPVKRVPMDQMNRNERSPQFATDEDEDFIDDGSAPNKQKLSKSELANCAFVQCDYGFSVDAARVTLKGCSFIMNKTHSVFIKNQKLESGEQLRKHANLKIRWPNYVEPYIDNGNALSNDSQMLTSVTQEKAFCGSADFEPVMYLPTLTERIRQARNLFRSREENNVPKARVIMRSVSHMLILLKTLSERLLNKELLDDPDLGMFAATFNLYQHKRGSANGKGSNTLVSMEDLFKSWKSLSRTRLFDSAIFALNEAFERKQVDEDLYDEWVTPLEEMQRVCFVKSKYNRRRDYLLTTAKETPLTTWYFLDKEDPSADEGKRLRKEVLTFLATDSEENRAQNKTGFHASWVAQWAVNLLGREFTSGKMPENTNLRRAWADKLLDAGKPKRILDAYKSVGGSNSYNGEIDQLIKYEALQLYENQGHKLSQEQYQQLSQMLGGEGVPGAMKAAAKLFKGVGALPGFLRRVAEHADNAEQLLEVLSSVHEDQSNPNRKQRLRVVMAVMSHFLNPDPQEEPKIYKRNEAGYETCPMCLVQKLQPWNELRLQQCDGDHRFCRSCIKASMSTGVTELWGRCPGLTDGHPCKAVACRREMELASMESEQIYNIISVRVTKHLQALKGWKQCDVPGCIGGRANVTKDYYTCRLCTKIVTMNGGEGDPTVSRRLLRGLDASSIARGEGTFRECYWCGVPYEKGNACSTITCSSCQKQFSMTWGPDKITHRFDEEGIGPQRYVPKVETSHLWKLGVFKTKRGARLKLGQTLTESEAFEVVRRAKRLLAELDG